MVVLPLLPVIASSLIFLSFGITIPSLAHANFMDLVKRETGLNIEIISPQEESRLAVVGCVPLLNRSIKRALVFDIGGGSTEVSLAKMSNSGRTIIEGFVSLPYGVVTVSEAFPEHEMTDLAYNTIIERTHKILAEFEEKYHIESRSLLHITNSQTNDELFV